MPDRDRPVTLRDIADHVGVNVATVSRALTAERRAMVNEETAQRIEAAARELGYRPNPIARGLKTNRSFTVGVLVPDLTNPLYPPIVRGVDDALSRCGYTPLIANSDNQREHEHAGFEALRARRVDGFVLATAAFRSHPLVDDAVAAGIPLVLCLRRIDGDRVPTVAVDERAGIAQAVAHLIELGHRAIAHVGGSQAMSPGLERCAGFQEATAAAGLPVGPEQVIVGERFTIDEGHRLCRELLARGERPTAIVAGNDLMALGCLDALAEAGLRCPDDVSIVGYNDMPLADRIAPPLTSVRIPQYGLGTRSAELLLDSITGNGAPPEVELLAPELVVRGSTRPV